MSPSLLTLPVMQPPPPTKSHILFCPRALCVTVHAASLYITDISFLCHENVLRHTPGSLDVFHSGGFKAGIIDIRSEIGSEGFKPVFFFYSLFSLQLQRWITALQIRYVTENIIKDVSHFLFIKGRILFYYNLEHIFVASSVFYIIYYTTVLLRYVSVAALEKETRETR